MRAFLSILMTYPPYYSHRFNRAQQDLLLPHVERGVITLIGATTENPSFSVNSALLSRCRVFVLKQLEIEHVMSLLRRAVDVKTKDLEELGKVLKIDESVLNRLAVLCDGDGTRADCM
jgi:putative ATPase